MIHLKKSKTAVDILETLNDKLSKLLSGDDIKAIQKIVIALGHICAKQKSLSQLNVALNLIFSLCRSKVGTNKFVGIIWSGYSNLYLTSCNL